LFTNLWTHVMFAYSRHRYKCSIGISLSSCKGNTSAVLFRRFFVNERWIIRKEYTRVRHLQQIAKADPVRQLTEALRVYMHTVRETKLDAFWHRKSNRVVLAMLYVLLPSGEAHFVHGINTEVSLPTGSICAERAAITRARTQMVNIHRGHMKGIAVIDVPFGDSDEAQLHNPLPPCGACREWLEKIQEESRRFYVLTYSDLTLQQVHERYMFWGETEETMKPKDLGPWTCRLCGSENIPFSVVCTECTAKRFSAQYNRAPVQLRFRQVLLALRYGHLSESQIWERLGPSSEIPQREALSAILQRLVRNERTGHNGEVYGRIVILSTSGKYRLTETGARMLETEA